MHNTAAVICLSPEQKDDLLVRQLRTKVAAKLRLPENQLLSPDPSPCFCKTPSVLSQDTLLKTPETSAAMPMIVRSSKPRPEGYLDRLFNVYTNVMFLISVRFAVQVFYY